MPAAIGGLVIFAVLFGALYLWETFKERTHEGTTSAKIVGGAEAIGDTIDAAADFVGSIFEIGRILLCIVLGGFAIYLGFVWSGLALFACAFALWYFF